MSNVLQQYEQRQVARLSNNKSIPSFKPGDTLNVMVKISEEGANDRLQAFEGVCIGRKNRGLNSSFTVRKISHGEGVERIFPLYSPLVESINVVRRGEISRAKLYYMRNLSGKAARIKEQLEFETTEGTEAKTAAPKKAKKEKPAKDAAASAEKPKKADKKAQAN